MSEEERDFVAIVMETIWNDENNISNLKQIPNVVMKGEWVCNYPISIQVPTMEELRSFIEIKLAREAIVLSLFGYTIRWLIFSLLPQVATDSVF